MRNGCQTCSVVSEFKRPRYRVAYIHSRHSLASSVPPSLHRTRGLTLSRVRDFAGLWILVYCCASAGSAPLAGRTGMLAERFAEHRVFAIALWLLTDG